jgi:hypothetical protein
VEQLVGELLGAAQVVEVGEECVVDGGGDGDAEDGGEAQHREQPAAPGRA